jgi:hypothetical protein
VRSGSTGCVMAYCAAARSVTGPDASGGAP